MADEQFSTRGRRPVGVEKPQSEASAPAPATVEEVLPGAGAVTADVSLAPVAEEVPANASTEDAAKDVKVDVFAHPVRDEYARMRAPRNAAPFSLGGVLFTPRKDGTVSVPHEYVTRLKAHGFEAA